ncbi:protein of unknown function [Paraburkholderia kururiensis]
MIPRILRLTAGWSHRHFAFHVRDADIPCVLFLLFVLPVCHFCVAVCAAEHKGIAPRFAP